MKLYIYLRISALVQYSCQWQIQDQDNQDASHKISAHEAEKQSLCQTGVQPTCEKPLSEIQGPDRGFYGGKGG